MTRVRFSALALQDLEEIVAYIGRDNKDAARRVVNRIEEVCFSLCEFPEIGAISEVPHARKLFVPDIPYKVVYEIVKKRRTVTILRIYHDARNTAY